MGYTKKTEKSGSNQFLYVFKGVCRLLYKLRGLILGIPVAAAAIVMAINNQVKLPDEVGVVLMASGEYSATVSKSVAILGPLALTGVCLVLVFCSKKVLYPWLISLFSLVLPLLILFINTFG